MANYSVKKLSQIAGVSIRTLHHYDKIGLLKPPERRENGYRYYGRNELFRLQQILFYRELDFPLKEIADILDDPEFDLREALAFHRRELLRRTDRIRTLVGTIDRTLAELNQQKGMMTDKEMYEGFKPELVESIRKEVADRWGEDELLETEARIRQMGKEGWIDHKAKGEEITQLLADLMELGPDHVQVQQTVALHHQYLNQFYEVSEERYRGLGKLYVEDERFTAYYEKFRLGLAAFVNQAIQVYCDQGMNSKTIIS
ncbi:MAG: MerR family transcriptional regulator [Bacteroidia bacterium]